MNTSILTQEKRKEKVKLQSFLARVLLAFHVSLEINAETLEDALRKTNKLGTWDIISFKNYAYHINDEQRMNIYGVWNKEKQTNMYSEECSQNFVVGVLLKFKIHLPIRERSSKDALDKIKKLTTKNYFDKFVDFKNNNLTLINSSSKILGIGKEFNPNELDGLMKTFYN